MLACRRREAAVAIRILGGAARQDGCLRRARNDGDGDGVGDGVFVLNEVLGCLSF
jgi:hypothetical protein